MLPWQALFDLAISKEIDENDIKGKEKSTIIFKIIHEALISDSEIDNLVNDYIYGDRVAFTLWNFENKLTPEQYEKVYQLEGETEPYLQANSFRGLTILSAKNCTDRIEVLYVYSKEYQFINEAGKSDSVWEQHRGCLWIGVGTAYLACISKHDKMMYTMINQNIHAAFKQDTADLVMCIMGSALYIAQPCIVRTEGVEVFFNQIDCFSCLPATAKENTKKYAVYLGEKCDGTCSNAKIGRCIADSSMACLPKAFYTLLPGFRPQPHKGLEYGDVAAQINVGSCAYEMKGIIKKNTMNSGRTSKSVDVLLNTHLLSTSKAGEEIIRQFVEQGLVDNRVDLIAVIAPQYFDNSFKGTLRFLAKLGGKKVMFIELDDVARLIEGNSAIDV